MSDYTPIPGYPHYGVSREGIVARIKPFHRRPSVNVPLNAHVGKNGYPYVNLRTEEGGAPKSIYVHSAVVLAFIGPKPQWADCIAHGNGIRTDCRLENLSWATYAMNSADSIRHGTSGRPGGERHFRAKLNADIIADATKMRESGMSSRAIARIFSVSHGTILNAVKGKSYKHAPNH